MWAAENSTKTKQVIIENQIEISREDERGSDALVEAGTRETEQFEGLKALKKDASTTPHPIEEKIRQAFPEDAEMAIKVAKCESSLQPDRIGDTHLAKPSIGLFQINQIWHDFDTETLLNVDENIKIAKQIYERSGKNWNRWTCGRLIASGLR